MCDESFKVVTLNPKLDLNLLIKLFFGIKASEALRSFFSFLLNFKTVDSEKSSRSDED